MSEQGSTPISTLQRPVNDDKEVWKAYWKAQCQSWRTEPEIDLKRQQYLVERHSITPDIEQGIYPFKDIKLSRADVEWLLAILENGRGPIDWSDKSQRARNGLDVRGANLSEVDLSGLPLAKLHGGVTRQERHMTNRKQRRMAAVHLEQADLSHTHLEGALLRNAYLEKANLESVHLERADCVSIHLQGAYLGGAYLGGAFLRRAYFDSGTFLNDVSLGNEQIGFVSLIDVRWGGATFRRFNGNR